MSYGFSYFVFLINIYSSEEGAEGMLFSNGNGDISTCADKVLASEVVN